MSDTRPCGGRSFVVFSDDWGAHPSSSQHLFRHIARDNKVLWVNTIGMRSPRLTRRDLVKAAAKLRRMLGARERERPWVAQPKNLSVCQPPMLPFSQFAAIRAYNARSVARSVQGLCKDLGIERPIVVSTVPNACDYVDTLDPQRVVYYCVDDFTTWPGLDHALVERMERALVARADVLLASSSTLLAKLSATGRNVHLLTHGVDADLFAAEPNEEHPVLSCIPRPRIGYYGLIDERTNQELVAATASALPNWSFVFTGPSANDLSMLRHCPNVYFTGPVPYAELPAIVKGLEALFIPYVVDRTTNAISPLKLKEYLITGKPVIATPLPGVANHPGVSVCTDSASWVAAIREVESESGSGSAVETRRKEMRQALAGESWRAKADRFVQLCVSATAK